MAKQSPRYFLLLRQLLKFMRADEETAPDQREDKKKLLKRQVSYSALSSQFILILSLASSIASLGLMANSAVAIVGAMLIAPLMKPIIAFAYGLVIADRRLQLRAFLTLCIGIMITVVIASLGEKIIGLHEPTVEIMARTHPSLIDLGVAIAAGVAAGLASIRRNVADTLPGVAIAVALVPPLCVSGIGLSVGAWSISSGAALLFFVNLVAIVFSAAMVYLLDGYGYVGRAWPGLIIILFVAAAVSVPLTMTLGQLRSDDLAQETIENYLHQQYSIDQAVHPNDLSRLDALLFKDHVFVFLEIKSPALGLSKKQIEKMHSLLEKAIKLPVNLKVQFLLTDEVTIYPYRLPNGQIPNYGGDDLIPRR